MNKPFLLAAGFAAFTAAVHIIVGGSDTVNPLLASSIPGEAKFTLYVVWHGISAILALSAPAFFIAAQPRYAAASHYLALFLSVLWCIFGLLFLLVIAMQPESGWLFRLPQWLILLPVGLLGLWGLYHSKPAKES